MTQGLLTINFQIPVKSSEMGGLCCFSSEGASIDITYSNLKVNFLIESKIGCPGEGIWKSRMVHGEGSTTTSTAA